MSVPSPIAQGRLSQTPLAHVIMSLSHRGLSGTLAIWPESGRGQDLILFEKGRIAATRLLQRSSDLERSLLPLFHRDDSPYAFYDTNLIEGESDSDPSISLDPLPIVLAALRGGMRAPIVRKILTAHRETPLRIRSDVDLGRFRWLAKERAFLDMFRAAPVNVAGALASAGQRKVGSRVLYMLSLAKALEAYEGEPERSSAPKAVPSGKPKPAAQNSPVSLANDQFDLPGLSEPPPPFTTVSSASPPSPKPSVLPKKGNSMIPPPRPSSLSEAEEQRWNEIVAYSEQIDSENYFEMLGVEHSASAAQVRDAYFAKVKIWHPDRLAPALKPLAAISDAIFRHLTEGERTLTDTKERGPYLSAVQAGGGTPKADREVAAVINAALDFQKVQVLLRRKDYVAAEELVRALVKVAPDESDYLAGLAAAIWGRQKLEGADEALLFLNQALASYPTHEAALMTKAKIFTRQDKKTEAEAIYRLVANANPKNFEASRALRLADMRSGSKKSKRPKSGKSGKSSKSGGFLSGFFGSKKK